MRLWKVLFLNSFYKVNLFSADIQQPLVPEFFESPEIKIDEDHLTTVCDHLEQENRVKQLKLFLTCIEHHQDLWQNNEAVLKGRALCTFHEGDFKLVCKMNRLYFYVKPKKKNKIWYTFTFLAS